MFLFNYQVREPFTPLIEGDIFAKDRAEAFNKIADKYTKELKKSVTELQISIEEVA